MLAGAGAVGTGGFSIRLIGLIGLIGPIGVNDSTTLLFSDASGRGGAKDSPPMRVKMRGPGLTAGDAVATPA
ncbi:MAG: hypothetical protein A2091_05275 [Desulfuromonadales bacterium GWD2_61_12]|nr:MAG: hypothetical protein A2091_05275 [Desulfuromonadales bacterium GWD2_61_12]